MTEKSPFFPHNGSTVQDIEKSGQLAARTFPVILPINFFILTDFIYLPQQHFFYHVEKLTRTVEIGLLLPSTVLTSAIFCYSKRIIRQKCQHLNFQKSFITACHRPALWKCKTESIPAFGLESGFNNWIKWTVNARSHTHKHKQAAYSLEKHPRPERWLLSCITTNPIAN